MLTISIFFSFSSLKVSGGYQKFLAESQGDAKEQRSGAYVLEQLETKLEDHEQQLLELNNFGEKITREYNEKVRRRGREGGKGGKERFKGHTNHTFVLKRLT